MQERKTRRGTYWWLVKVGARTGFGVFMIGGRGLGTAADDADADADEGPDDDVAGGVIVAPEAPPAREENGPMPGVEGLELSSSSSFSSGILSVTALAATGA